MADAVNSTTAPHPDRVFPRFTQAEPLPGLASRKTELHAAETAAAMNAVQAALNAILSEGTPVLKFEETPSRPALTFEHSYREGGVNA